MLLYLSIGVKHIRGAVIYEILDEENIPLNDPGRYDTM